MPYTKPGSKLIKVLDRKSLNVELLEENKGKIHDMSLGNDIVGMTPKG